MRRKLLLITTCLFSLVSQLQAQEITITAANWNTYFTDVQNGTRKDWHFKDIDELRNAKKITISSLPTSGGTNRNVYIVHSQGASALANLEELTVYLVNSDNRYFVRQLTIQGGTKLKKLVLWTENGTNTYAGCNSNDLKITVDNAFLTPENIIFQGNGFVKANGERTVLGQLILKRNKITDLTALYPLISLAQNVQLNGGKYHRLTYAGVDDGTYNPTNLIREIDMTKIVSERMTNILIRHNLLEKITDITQSTINGVELNNNLMWSLDLSNLTATSTNYRVGPQKPYADLTVVKGDAVDGSQDEVRLYLPEGQSELFDESRLVDGSVKLLGQPVSTQAILGTPTEKYFKVASVADGVSADLDLYARHNGFSYQYNTRPALTDEVLDSLGQNKDNVRDMEVEVKTYPYIMYVHPATKSGAGVDYYSGTLWLDYDAIVPKGTTVWIVTDIHKDKVLSGGTTQVGNQLVMEMIGSEGALIPAGTAMYVRSDTKAGLYAFQKAWKHDIKGWDGPSATSVPEDTLWYDKVLTNEQIEKLAAQRAKIGDRNLLQGSATPTTFANKREALVLGIENQKGTGMIGFWPFNGTELAAHRCYISEATYRRVTGDTESNAKGATFFFSDEGTTGITHIKSTDAGTTDDAWYSLDGRKFRAKPTIKGVYIHKGRKEVIR